MSLATLLISFPDVDWFKRCLIGALDQMTLDFNWTENGDVAISFALEESEKMLQSYIFMGFNPIPVGLIQPFAGILPPDGYLVCDGMTYASADYPELFAAIAYNFGGSGATFAVPALTDRSIVGAGSSFAFASNGGEIAHTLETSEIPSHSHTIPLTATTLAVEPGEVTVMTPIPVLTSNTGDTGGGSSHNNMQPYLALTYCIYAGR